MVITEEIRMTIMIAVNVCAFGLLIYCEAQDSKEKKVRDKLLENLHEEQVKILIKERE